MNDFLKFGVKIQTWKSNQKKTQNITPKVVEKRLKTVCLVTSAISKKNIDIVKNAVTAGTMNVSNNLTGLYFI